MKLTVNALAMPPGRYGAWHIDRWSVTVASSEAPKRRHQASAHAVSARRMPWSLLLLSRSKNTTQVICS